jgi:hypothetical protein
MADPQSYSGMLARHSPSLIIFRDGEIIACADLLVNVAVERDNE